jgi:hypothetical protein
MVTIDINEDIIIANVIGKYIKIFLNLAHRELTDENIYSTDVPLLV